MWFRGCGQGYAPLVAGAEPQTAGLVREARRNKRFSSLAAGPVSSVRVSGRGSIGRSDIVFRVQDGEGGLDRSQELALCRACAAGDAAAVAELERGYMPAAR